MNIELYTQEMTSDLMDLLLLADPDKKQIKSYIDNSTIFVAKESNLMIGVVVISIIGGQYEIKNIAVLESHQRRGVAKQLIFKAKDYARDEGASTITVGTGNSSLSQLALYQKCDFRMKHIKSNYFKKYPEDIFENGIRCLDMIVLSAKL